VWPNETSNSIGPWTRKKKIVFVQTNKHASAMDKHEIAIIELKPQEEASLSKRPKLAVRGNKMNRIASPPKNVPLVNIGSSVLVERSTSELTRALSPGKGVKGGAGGGGGRYTTIALNLKEKQMSSQPKASFYTLKAGDRSSLI